GRLCLLAAYVLIPSAATTAAPGEAPPVPESPAALTQEPKLPPDVLLFGDPRGAARVESEQELRRPSDSPRPTNTLGENRTLDRRSTTGLGWRSRDLLPLAGVLGLIAVLALVVRRYMPARRMLGASGVLEIVARTPLSPKQH